MIEGDQQMNRPCFALVLILALTLILTKACAAQTGGSLQITVTDLSNAVIPRAHVQVLGSAKIDVVAGVNGVALVDNLPAGSYKIIVSGLGFRDKLIPSVQITAGIRENVKALLQQALPKSSDIHAYPTLDSRMYSNELQLLKEPEFCQSPIPAHTESYRFLWVPTFYHPIFMQVQIQQDGAAVLHLKIFSGAGGYNWGHIEKNTTRKLSPIEETELFTTLADIGFWNLPARIEFRNPYEVMVDGTDWVIEGVHDGNCHAITRYASPLTDIFSKYFLGEVAKLKPYLH